MFLFSTQISPKISKTRDRVRDTGTGILIRKIRKSGVNPSLFGILKYTVITHLTKILVPAPATKILIQFLFLYVIYNNPGIRDY